MSARPEVVPPQPWAFPEPQRHTLSNGISLLAYDIPGQYVVSVRTVLPLPLTVEPREREGVAALTARLLDEGTKRHTSEEFAQLLERKGIAMGAGMSDSGLSVDLDVPKRRLGEALDLLQQALGEPVFPEAEVTRHVKTRLAEIEQERAMAPHRAAREFIATFFDSGERASRPGAGSHETVSSLTRDDFVDFHRRFIGPQGMTVVVAGDLTDLDVAALADESLGQWRTDGQEVAEPSAEPPARAADAARIVLVDRPGSVQSELSVGCAGPDRRAEGGWAAYPVLAFVVGGSPNARVDAVLREEKGFTYGIRSSFRPRRRGGLFLTNGSVRADSTVESVKLLLEILESGREGFNEAEVRAGIDFISKTAPGRYATADAVADEAATMALDGLTTQFTTDNLLAMQALDGDALVQAYRRWVDGQWTVVVVGDAGLYADQLKELGRGEVTVVPN
ncbi:pitrilysin family protein [Knoellia sp. 3-2P3]|uniref:M16 family metallopeptidase n=1 Tax=unclassified Knoellia TaxID=2618719 RepID=UPI0023DC133B|nr:pitrilysin family protein [Knoellia sp. 3-2P3]MDF2093502.1 pitrilysin family protein [Knoellia sp. 3-2P3]